MTIVVWVGNAPLGSFVWTLDPQLVASVGYVLESLGDFPNWEKYDIKVGLRDFFFKKVLIVSLSAFCGRLNT